MFYNLLIFPSENSISSHLQYLQAILHDYRPSLYTSQEFYKEDAADTIMNPQQFSSFDDNVVLSEDLYMINGHEALFQELTATSNIINFIDPTNSIGNWHNPIIDFDLMTRSLVPSDIENFSNGDDDRFNRISTLQNMWSDPEPFFVEFYYQANGNHEYNPCDHCFINLSNCFGADNLYSIKDVRYNFIDHLPVTLKLLTNQSLHTSSFTSTTSLVIKSSDGINEQMQSQHITVEIEDQPLSVFNSLNQQVETIMINNTLYNRKDASQLANVFYFSVLPDKNQQPLNL